MRNSFHLYPAWSCWNWIIFTVVTLVWFSVLEYLGLRRWHGAIPYSWLLRDAIPRLVRVALVVWLLYHFGFLGNESQPLR